MRSLSQHRTELICVVTNKSTSRNRCGIHFSCLMHHPQESKSTHARVALHCTGRWKDVKTSIGLVVIYFHCTSPCVEATMRAPTIDSRDVQLSPRRCIQRLVFRMDRDVPIDDALVDHVRIAMLDRGWVNKGIQHFHRYLPHIHPPPRLDGRQGIADIQLRPDGPRR